MRSCRPILLASTLLLPLLLSCAGGSDVFQAGDGNPVTVSPKVVTLPPGGSQLFQAKVGIVLNQNVTWTVVGGAANGGFTGSTGVYTAPYVPGTYTIVAASEANGSMSDLATVVVNTPLTVSLTPKTASLPPSGTQLFTATVGGTTSQAITWTALSTGSTAADAGSFHGTTGLYKAPDAFGTYLVIAKATLDPTKLDTAIVTVGNPHQVRVSPNPVSLLPGASQTFSADIAGVTNTLVDWSVDEGPSGGFVDQATGVYTAPQAVGTYHVRATWRANPAVTGSTTVHVSHVGVSVSPATAVLDQGATQVFTPTLTGTTNSTLHWQILSSSEAPVAATGPYAFTAPTHTDPVPHTFTLRATSAADPAAFLDIPVIVRAVDLALTPSSALLASGGTLQFNAVVSGTTNPGVQWSVQPGGAGGAISAAGLYTAPNTTLGTDTIVAAASGNPAIRRTANVTVNVPSVLVAPSTASLNPGDIQTFTATVVGSANQTVTWSISSQPAGAAATISTAGIFIAPVTSGTYRIRATSAVHAGVFGEAVVTVP